MIKFFLRFYTGVATVIILSFFLVWGILKSQHNTEADQDYIHTTNAWYSVLGSMLASQPQSEWANILRDMKTELPFYVTLTDRSVLSVLQQQKLEKTGVVSKIENGLLADQIIAYYSLPASDQLMSMKLVKSFNHNSIAILLMFLLAGSALALIIIIWPIATHVNKLVKVSSEAGQGNFYCKADESAPPPLDKLSIAMNNASGQIHKLISEREMLAGAASHEFRTPLMRLRFALELAGQIDDPVKLKEHMSSMSEDIERMELLVSEWLTYTKFGSHVASSNREHIFLLELFETVKRRMQPLQPGCRFEIDCSPEVRIHACRLSMTCVLENLVQNAQKYGNGYIGMFGNRLNDTGKVSIQVADDGNGIAEQERSAVLRPFYRARDIDQKAGGVGLGLAIVNHIVSLHQGELNIQTNHHHGTTVEVIL